MIEEWVMLIGDPKRRKKDRVPYLKREVVNLLKEKTQFLQLEPD